MVSFCNGQTNNFECVIVADSREGIIRGMNTEQANQATIFVVEEDDDTRPVLKSNLQRDGYRIAVALDEEGALERISGGYVRADLVLIDLVGRSPEDVLSVGRRIREHAKYDGHTPLVVLAEKYGADVEGTDVNVGGNDWITYLEDHDQLKNLLARLLNKSSS
jgi:DNA-binding response OmpR family regulator